MCYGFLHIYLFSYVSICLVIDLLIHFVIYLNIFLLFKVQWTHLFILLSKFRQRNSLGETANKNLRSQTGLIHLEEPTLSCKLNSIILSKVNDNVI